MPWILCGPGWPPLRIGDSSGSTAMILTSGLRDFRTWPTPGDGAARADAGDDDVDLAVGVLPDLLGRGLAVDLGVGRVGELAGEDAAALGRDLVGALDGTLHPGGRVGEDELGAEGTEEGAALLRHRLRHGEHDVVASGGADHGEGDAGVARRRLDDRAAGLELTARLGGVDDGHPDAVLDGAGGVVELELRGDGRLRSVGDLVESDEWRVADQLGHVVVNGHCVAPSGRSGGRWRRSCRLSQTIRIQLMNIPTQGYPLPSPGAAAIHVVVARWDRCHTGLSICSVVSRLPIHECAPDHRDRHLPRHHGGGRRVARPDRQPLPRDVPPRPARVPRATTRASAPGPCCASSSGTLGWRACPSSRSRTG